MTKPMTDLDKQLQQMALLNWDQFAQLIGPDALIAAKVCLLRQDKRSYGEIAIKLKLAEHQVRYGCTKCDLKH